MKVKKNVTIQVFFIAFLCVLPSLFSEFDSSSFQPAFSQAEFSKILENSKHALPCGMESPSEKEESLTVFMSFSLSDQVWIEISKVMEKVGGRMVIRGLPQNRFVELSRKIQDLSCQGVKATIQIHPKLFQQHNIEQVPVFLVSEETKHDKLSGNVSLAFALDVMAQKGETALAKRLKEKLDEKIF